MLLVRDVFRCRPGKAKVLAEMLKETIPSMERDDGFRHCRVLVDLVASYWTVVLQAEVEDLAAFERHSREFSGRAEVRQAMHGYLDLVLEGHREVYRIV